MDSSPNAKKAKQKKKPWRRPRHRVIRNIAAVVLYPFMKLKYHVTFHKLEKSLRGRPYLVLYNHQTPFDQFFVGMTVPGPIYYVASEDIFSTGFIAKLLRYAVAPIPIRKASNDFRAVIDCIRVAAEGGTIAIAPEGNRTYSGRTCYIKDSIAPLARKLKLPLLFVRIEGGYGVNPRWSDKCRKGKMQTRVSRIVEPDEIEKLTNEELYDLICTELSVDEANADHIFLGKRRAEFLERALYYCPDCGLSTFHSEKNEVECLRCHKKITYGESTELIPVAGTFPYRFFADWYEAQEDFIRSLDLGAYLETPAFTDTASLYSVVLYKEKVLLEKETHLALYGDRITLTEAGAKTVLPFREIRSISVLGHNKMNISIGDRLLQIKGNERFNALKYTHFYYHSQGEQNGKFLGL